MLRSTCFAMTVVLLLGFGKAHAAVVTLVGTDYSEVGGPSPVGLATDSTATLPYIAMLNATISTGYATTGLDRTSSYFHWTFEHTRPADAGGYTDSYGSWRFTVDVLTSFTIAGHLKLADSGSGGVSLFAGLGEVISGPKTMVASLWYADGASYGVPGNTVTLTTKKAVDKKGGVSSSNLLEPGHIYEFRYDATTYTNPDDPAPSAAVALGDVSITFTPVSSVPEPSSVVVWSSFGVIGLLAAWRARKRRAA